MVQDELEGDTPEEVQDSWFHQDGETGATALAVVQQAVAEGHSTEPLVTDGEDDTGHVGHGISELAEGRVELGHSAGKKAV